MVVGRIMKGSYCLRIIEWYSQMWGGGYNLIIPTDGATIEPDFWFILEQFSPDYIYYYAPSLADIQSINPMQWEKIVEERIQYSLGTQEPSDDEVNTVCSQIEEYATEALISDFELTECLGKQLIRKLNPFHSEHWLQGKKVTFGSKVYYPLVDLVHVLPQIIDLLFQTYHEINLSVIDELVIYASLGSIREAYEKEMKEAGVRISRQTYSPEQQRNLVDLIFHHTDQIPPFRASMLNLGLYYPIAARRKWEDSVVLILGDSLKDFCLYFSLSRLRPGVYWLPYRPESQYTYTPSEWRIFYQEGLLRELEKRMTWKRVYLVSKSLEEQAILEAKERLVEPEWFYKLDELFYQGWEHDMYVPVLTLAKLQKDAKTSFLYIPEIGYSHDADFIDPEMEIDICAVYDGDIILRECKKSCRLEKSSSKEKEIIGKYLAIAEKIGAKRLIFSTFQEKWADAMMDNVHELLSGSEIRPEFLTKSELLEESD